MLQMIITKVDKSRGRMLQGEEEAEGYHGREKRPNFIECGYR